MELKPWHRHYDYSVPTTIRYPRLPVHELLGIPANAYPDKAALNFFGTEMTFWELRTPGSPLGERPGDPGDPERGAGGNPPAELPPVPDRLLCGSFPRGDRGEHESPVHGR